MLSIINKGNLRMNKRDLREAAKNPRMITGEQWLKQTGSPMAYLFSYLFR